MLRGDIWRARIPGSEKSRPVVLVSRQPAIDVRLFVIVAEVTTRIRGLETEISLGSAEGLPRPCVVNADNLHMIDKRRFSRYYGRLPSAKIERLDDALRFALGLD